MNVGELRRLIASYPDSAPVVLSVDDDEGEVAGELQRVALHADADGDVCFLESDG